MVRFRLGERVRFKAVVKKEHWDNGRLEFVREEKLPKNYDSYPGFDVDEGIIFGYRHVTSGTRISGSPGGWTLDGYDPGEGPSFVPDKDATKKVWLVSFDMRRKPVMVFDDDIESIDGDRLLPYQKQPAKKLADGSTVYPSDPRWGIRARTATVPNTWVEQIVVASSLKEALTKAQEIPLQDWLPREED